MDAESHLLLFRQQERELEERLRRRVLRTCCRAVATATRSWRDALARRLHAVGVPAPRTLRTTPEVAPACCAA